jgi:acetylornithine deacetylase
MLTDLLELLEIESVGGTDAEAHAQSWVADKLRAWGWDVELHEDDPAAFADHPDYPGMEVSRTRVISVIGSPPGGRRTTLLLGHTDVVPGGPPPGLTDAAVHGRGSVDMKSGLVAAMHAAKAVGGDVAVCAVSGEEDGGIGAFLALRHGLAAQRCVIPEPTDLAIIPANAGSLTFRITIDGTAAHGAMRWDGLNALEEVPEILRRLATLEAERNRLAPPIMASWPIAYPISVGRIRGGDWPSTVMGAVSLEGRFGVALGESLADAMSAFEEALGGTGARIEWFGGRFASASVDVDRPWIAALRAAHEDVTGSRPVVMGATYGSDLRQLVAAGIPTVQYGPGNTSLAHSANENVSLAQVIQYREVLERWLRQ